jgi:hypothetical protein
MKKKHGRATNSLRNERIKQVMDLIGKGLYSYEIADRLSKEWKCSERSVYNYIDIVKKIVSNEISKQDVNDLMLKFDHLHTLAMLNKDYKLANQILANKAKYSVGEKHNVDLNLNLKNMFGFDE